MTAKVLEKMPCLFSCRDLTPCEGTKVFRTGTPLCLLHLRDIFGIDADYSQPQLMPDQTVQTHGPYLYTSPEISHSMGTIVLGGRETIDSILNNRGPLLLSANKQTIRFLNKIKSDAKLPEQYKRWVAETLRNMFEPAIELRENDGGLRKALESRFKDVNDAITMYTDTTQLANNITLPVASDSGPERTVRLGDLPLILQQFAINMRPSIINNTPVADIEYHPTTSQSNIMFTKSGFMAENTLFHREVFVLAAEAQTNMTSYLTQKRPTSAGDRTDCSLQALAEFASKAHPKPLDSWGNLLAGKEDAFSYCLNK